MLDSLAWQDSVAENAGMESYKRAFIKPAHKVSRNLQSTYSTHTTRFGSSLFITIRNGQALQLT